MTDRPEKPENSQPDQPSALEPAAVAAAAGAPDASLIPEAVVASRWHTAPWLVWLIPIVAAAVGGWILAHSIMTRGPTITIVFKNAEGLEAGKTKIKYKEVDIGVVKSIALTKDRARVVVTAELAKGSDSFLRQDTHFWVVRPRIGAGGISGLSTLLSGSYIGLDVGKSEEERDAFVGLDIAPLVLTDLPGRRFVLHADHMGSLDAGSSIYFRRIEVGQVVAYELDKQGRGVNIHVFINAPYDQYVTNNTRFWNASGIELTLDANGFKLQSESLASVLAGGIAFQTPPDVPIAPPANENTPFTLYTDRDNAMKHADSEVRKVLLYFKESARGLVAGAPVDFRGIVIGEVTQVSLEYDKQQKIFLFPVEVNLYPDRLRAHYRAGADRPDGEKVDREVLDQLVEHGLRAQLKSGNLLTGMLYVALDFFPEAATAKIDWSKKPIVLATVPGTLEELQTTLLHISRKLDNVPIDDIATDLHKAIKSLDLTLQSTDKLVKRLDSDVAPQARETLEQARKTLATAERTLSSDAPLQQDLRDALREIGRSAESLRTLTDYLDRHPESLIRGKTEDHPQ
ncbi:MAG: MlaD family protein [Burkholderiaceae bacterium]|nr:MlaD family protein [Burkholderiaceae bacterium]